MVAPRARRDWVGTPGDASDAQLVAAAQHGQEAAWAALVRRYQRLVFSIARKHRLSPDDADAVFHAVFAELWRSLTQFEAPAPLRAWLATAARRHSQAQIHCHRGWVNLAEFEALPAGELMEDAVLREAESEQAMRRALERLPPRCRRELEWLFVSEPPPDYAEIGRRLGLAGHGIGWRRGRCLRTLRQALASAANQA